MRKRHQANGSANTASKSKSKTKTKTKSNGSRKLNGNAGDSPQKLRSEHNASDSASAKANANANASGKAKPHSRGFLTRAFDRYVEWWAFKLHPVTGWMRFLFYGLTVVNLHFELPMYWRSLGFPERRSHSYLDGWATSHQLEDNFNQVRNVYFLR